jgi:class 3 adenylate cyclase
MDARPFLPLVQTPVLALNSSHALTPPATGRYVAEHVANGRFIEVPGTTQEIYSAPNHEEIEDLIEEFLTGSKPLLRADRVLASVLFTDIVASTETAVQLGDAKWKTLLEEHDRGAHDAIASWGGRIANHTGDGILATFDGPGRSIRCALQMQHELRRHGIRIRSGIHFGEIEQRADGNVGGIGVHVAARVLSQAVADEIVCTRTVKELCFGSGIEFEDRGTHVLKGIPDSWSLFAVAGASAV